MSRNRTRSAAYRLRRITRQEAGSARRAVKKAAPVVALVGFDLSNPSLREALGVAAAEGVRRELPADSPAAFDALSDVFAKAGVPHPTEDQPS